MTAAEQPRPVLEVTVAAPRHIGDVVKWANLAESIGVPSHSPVLLETIGRKSLTVRAFLDQTEPTT